MGKNNMKLVELYEMKNELGELLFKTDKGGKHNYLSIYDVLFHQFMHFADILEVGVKRGGSLRLWEKYFHSGKVWGLDIKIYKHLPQSERIKIFKCSSTNKKRVNKILKKEKFDIIIDDGSHKYKDQLSTFKILKNRIKVGGLYIIEDILGLGICNKLVSSIPSSFVFEIYDGRKKNMKSDELLIICKKIK